MQETARPKDRLTTGQMIDLMRLEVERALRHNYPISCIVVGLEGYMGEELTETRRAAMIEVFRGLKQVCFGKDVRGLGVWTLSYQLAVFPHVDPKALGSLAESLLESAREIEGFDEEIRLAIGVAHNLHPGEVSFESMVEEAESGMQLAMAGGADRIVQAREVESEVTKLRDDIARELDAMERGSEAKGEAQALDDWGKPLLSGLRRLFDDNDPGHDERLARLQQEVLQLVKGSVKSWRESDLVSQMAASKRQIQRLERRVAKLNQSLGATEGELKRVAAMKNIDLGVSSIYRKVQGLSDDDEGAGAKKEMLKNLFDANVALRQAMSSKAS